MIDGQDRQRSAPSLPPNLLWARARAPSAEIVGERVVRCCPCVAEEGRRSRLFAGEEVAAARQPGIRQAARNRHLGRRLQTSAMRASAPHAPGTVDGSVWSGPRLWRSSAAFRRRQGCGRYGARDGSLSVRMSTCQWRPAVLHALAQPSNTTWPITARSAARPPTASANLRGRQGFALSHARRSQAGR